MHGIFQQHICRNCLQISKCDYAFPRIIQKYTKFTNSQGYNPIFSTFYNILQPNVTIASCECPYLASMHRKTGS